MIQVLAVVFLLIVFLLALPVLDKRFVIFPELKRKILHIALGVTSISFYWIMDETWQVNAVCLVVTLVLFMIRGIPKLKKLLGGSLFDVNRTSAGDLLFPLSVCLLFPLCAKNPILYIAPLSILTFSDSIAAIIGKCLGKKVFDVMGGVKSWEGTFAFSMTTFIIMGLCLATFTSISPAHMLWIAISFAVFGALIEAISWSGVDNFFIPIGAYLFLQNSLNQTDSQAFLTLVLLSGLIFIGLILGPKSRLNTHALMTAIISVYLFGIVGGVLWILPLLLVFLCHIALVKIQGDEATYTFNAVIGITSAGFFWLMVQELFHFNFSFFMYVVACALHLQMMSLLRLKALRERPAEPLVILFVTLLCGGVMLSLGLFYYGVTREIMILYASSLAVMFLGGVLLTIKSNRASSQRWIAEALMALVGSASALIPLGVMVWK